jgi:hypothetical protein
LPRQDDFINAFKLAAAELLGRDPVEVGLRSRAAYDPEQAVFSMAFIGKPCRVHLKPEVRVEAPGQKREVPIQEQGLILHYLNAADGSPLAGELITYREVPSGEFYYPAFVKRAEAPLAAAFGRTPERLVATAAHLVGEPVAGMGDAAVRIQALPMVALTLMLWGGDEEFEPTSKILFDRSISHYFSTEDIAVLSGMVVYRLLGLAAAAGASA